MSFNSDGLREIYSRLGIVGRNPVVAPNGFEREAFEGERDVSLLRARLGLPIERKIVCYCGNTYRGRERDNALWREMARQEGADNFRMEGFVAQREVSFYLLASDVLVMPYSSGITIRDGTEAGGIYLST